MSAIKYRKLDSNGDYTFGRRNEFYNDAEAVAQAVRTRLLLLKGEWWENILDGTPFYQEIAGKFFPLDENASQVDLIIAERITGTSGVKEITEFVSNINPQSRTYSATISVMTVYDVEIQLNINGNGSLLNVTFRGGE